MIELDGEDSFPPASVWRNRKEWKNLDRTGVDKGVENDRGVE